MTDREKFQENLNYYLTKYNKMQKDLAEYVGAKTTTVSGWTRGISYPRSDAMEKIANFFGIPTSRLIGLREDEEPLLGEVPQTAEVRILMRGMSKLPQEKQEQLLNVARAMFSEYADFFKEGDNGTKL